LSSPLRWANDAEEASLFDLEIDFGQNVRSPDPESQVLTCSAKDLGPELSVIGGNFNYLLKCAVTGGAVAAALKVRSTTALKPPLIVETKLTWYIAAAWRGPIHEWSAHP